MTPSVWLRWDHQVYERGRKVRSTYIGGGGSFETYLLEGSETQAVAGMRLEYHKDDNLHFFSNMSFAQGEHSRDSQYTLALGVEKRF